jgi:aspartyl aminopeptidase
MIPLDDFNRGLLDFLAASPTPFHVAANALDILTDAGYEVLDEGDAWSVAPGGRYAVVRNGSALLAFALAEDSASGPRSGSRGGSAILPETGLRMVGAHTDSPCLRVKPRPRMVRHGALQLGVEVYGGALLNPWFDRDLSMAGRVTCRTGDGALVGVRVDYREPVAVIPSLAIHFDREANKNRTVNAQDDLPPVLALATEDGDPPDFREMLRLRLREEYPDLDVAAVLDFEINLYDTQPPALVGLKREFIAGARLDNLVSCYVGLRALADADPGVSCLLILNDHEEVGSGSAAGAQGPFLRAVLNRLCPDPESLARTLARSELISADDAHGVHPNFAARSDPEHRPVLNGGPVIKVNANHRYASNSETSARFRTLCETAGVPVQEFVMRSDLACGSTIGPLTETRIGVPTVDVGVPIWAMHSIRETGGALDPHYLYRVLRIFFGASATNVASDKG